MLALLRPPSTIAQTIKINMIVSGTTPFIIYGLILCKPWLGIYSSATGAALTFLIGGGIQGAYWGHFWLSKAISDQRRHYWLVLVIAVVATVITALLVAKQAVGDIATLTDDLPDYATRQRLIGGYAALWVAGMGWGIVLRMLFDQPWQLAQTRPRALVPCFMLWLVLGSAISPALLISLP